VRSISSNHDRTAPLAPRHVPLLRGSKGLTPLQHLRLRIRILVLYFGQVLITLVDFWKLGGIKMGCGGSKEPPDGHAPAPHHHEHEHARKTMASLAKVGKS
jgi:hypothetical protein